MIDWGMLRLEGKVDGITNTHRAISSFEDIMKDDNDTEILDSDA